MEIMGVVSIPAIAIICYAAAEAAKALGMNEKYCPVLVFFLGGLLGAAALYVMPGFPVSDIINAIAVGIVSGLAATGAHQIYKQLGEKE